MRIDVLNGVNLDQLGRRDPALYGDASLQDLETTIYGWALELALQVRCRQTNHEGEYVEFLHAALDNADALVVNPGAWTHYSWAIRDALEPFPGACDRGAPLGRGRAGGVAPGERPRGSDDGQGDGAGGRRLPTGARAARRGEGGMNRIERLAGRLEEPLLVTNLVNVRYLTGLASSNAAVLVDPAGDATLYTDFRYAEAASAIDGVTFERTPRQVLTALAELLSGRRIAVEARHLSLADADGLRTGGVEVVATTGVVEGLRAVKEPGELELLRRAASISDQVYTELAQQQFVGRTEAELQWWLEQAWHDAGADGPGFDAIVAFGENGARPHAHVRDLPIPADTLVIVDAGCAVEGYRSDCTRTFFTGATDGRLRELYDLCLEGQLAGLAAVAPGAHGRDVDAASRVAIEAAGMGELYGHGLGHGVGLDVHEEPSLRPESTPRCSRPGNVVTVEPGIYLAGRRRRQDRGHGRRHRRRLRAPDDRDALPRPGRLTVRSAGPGAVDASGCRRGGEADAFRGLPAPEARDQAAESASADSRFARMNRARLPESRPARRAPRRGREVSPQAPTRRRTFASRSSTGSAAPDEPVAHEQRQDVVAVLAASRAARRSRAGSGSPTAPPSGRGRGRGRSNGERSVARSGTSPSRASGWASQASPLEADAERAEPPLLAGSLGVRERKRLGLGIPALGEVPEPVVGRAARRPRARRGGGAP